MAAMLKTLEKIQCPVDQSECVSEHLMKYLGTLFYDWYGKAPLVTHLCHVTIRDAPLGWSRYYALCKYHQTQTLLWIQEKAQVWNILYCVVRNDFFNDQTK